MAYSDDLNASICDVIKDVGLWYTFHLFINLDNLRRNLVLRNHKTSYI